MVNLDDLYNPNLGGAGEGYVHEPAATPRQQMEQIAKLRHAYAELKKELLEEIAGVDARIIRPLTDAREYIQPMRKVIKKRENRRLDYERYRQQVDNIARKSGQTDKDAASLVKAEVELSKATDVSPVEVSHRTLSKCHRIFVLLMHTYARHCLLSWTRSYL
jgi:amphiphysin